MTDRLDLYFRAHTKPAVEAQEKHQANKHSAEPKQALIFRCVMTGDEKRELLFGAYILSLIHI